MKRENSFLETNGKKIDYLNILTNLGTTLQVPEKVEKGLEKFIYVFYGNERMQKVTDERKKMFLQKFTNEKKIDDLSLLPP